MKPNKYFIPVCINILIFFSFSAVAQSDLEIIRKRVIDELMQPAVNASQIKLLMNSIREDGSWPGINYVDLSNEGFQNARHLANLQVLSLAYRKKGSPFQGDHGLKKVIDKALDYWLKNDFICENWWWNQIGTPDRMVDIYLILDEEISDEQNKGAQPIFDRATMNAWGTRPGGDRIKIAEIYGKYGLLKRSEKIFTEVVGVMTAEIKISEGRGLQADMSFHHRVDRVNNTLSYGTQYADVFARWAVLVRNTKFAFPEKATDMLIDYYLDGICQMMVYGKYPDPGAKNRAITRRGALDAWSPVTPEDLLSVSGHRSAELEYIIKIRNNEIKPSVSRDRFFWDSEYYSHQRPGYFASVRMFSTRNKSMEEPYNSEGLKNHHLGDGADFISVTGREYNNIWPVYDWQRIPGTTVVQRKMLPAPDMIQQAGTMDFVGGVTDGLYGAAAFDFISPLDSLVARKAWFLFDDEIVCLGAGITSGTGMPVNTTINQCYLHGDVYYREDGKINTLAKGTHHLNEVSWVNHENIAYIFPGHPDIQVMNDTASGSWYDINKGSGVSRTTVHEQVFKLWLDHGINPKEEKYDYVIVPGIKPNKVDDYTESKRIQVLENSKKLQAVFNSGSGIFQAVFYEPGEIVFGNNIKVTMENPGLLMIILNNEDIKEITVEDPARKLKTMELTVGKKIALKNENAVLNWNASEGKTKITVGLPDGLYAGESVLIR